MLKVLSGKTFITFKLVPDENFFENTYYCSKIKGLRTEYKILNNIFV
jgi:hypothetical protein